MAKGTTPLRSFPRTGFSDLVVDTFALGTGAVTANELAAGAVTVAQLSANMALRTPDREAGTITTTTGTEVLINCPVAGTINAIAFVAKDALATSNTNYIAFGVINKQAGAGTGVVVDNTNAANSTKTTGGAAIAAYAHFFMTLGAATTVAAGDILALSATVTGTLANQVTEGLWVVNIVPSS